MSHLQSANGYDPFLAYSRSKLANLLFTYELARRYGHQLAIAAPTPVSCGPTSAATTLASASPRCNSSRSAQGALRAA